MRQGARVRGPSGQRVFRNSPRLLGHITRYQRERQRKSRHIRQEIEIASIGALFYQFFTCASEFTKAAKRRAGVKPESANGCEVPCHAPATRKLLFSMATAFVLIEVAALIQFCDSIAQTTVPLQQRVALPVSDSRLDAIRRLYWPVTSAFLEADIWPPTIAMVTRAGEAPRHREPDVSAQVQGHCRHDLLPSQYLRQSPVPHRCSPEFRERSLLRCARENQVHAIAAADARSTMRAPISVSTAAGTFRSA